MGELAFSNTRKKGMQSSGSIVQSALLGVIVSIEDMFFSSFFLDLDKETQ